MIFIFTKLLFAMDPSLQPRARNLYEKFATNPVGELYMMQALIKFYVGKSLDTLCKAWHVTVSQSLADSFCVVVRVQLLLGL